MKKANITFVSSLIVLVLFAFSLAGLVYAQNALINPDAPLAKVSQGTGADEKRSQIQGDKDKLNQAIEQNRNLYELQAAELSKQEQDLIALQQRANEQGVLIEKTNKSIQEKNIEIEDKKIEVAAAQSEVDEQIKMLRKRLRTMYKFGKTGYLQIVLKSDSLVNAMTRMDRVRLLAEHDRNLLATLKQAKLNLERAQRVLESEERALTSLKEEQVQQKEALERTTEQVLAKKRQTLSNIDALNRQKAQFEKEISFLETELKKLAIKRDYVGGTMGWPLDLGYNYITSYFGPRRSPTPGASSNHGAIDIGVPRGQNVYAALDGEVIASEYMYGYGNLVILDHGGGISTLYAHCDQRYVDVGDTVQQGETIAASGNTGISTGPHLHFEVRINGTRVDPLDYVVVP